VEADIADGISLTDVYLNYGTGPVTITAGQVKPFWGLEEMTSDLFTSFMERSTISQAFGFERRVGLSAQYAGKEVLLQGGVFGANAEDLNDHLNKSISVDGRVVWMPKLGDDVQLHLGGSAHMRNLNQDDGEVRYRARPGTHTTSFRLVDTGDIASRGERSFGLEASLQKGPFHATAEGYWQKLRRLDGPNPTFFGGYAEVGMVLTPGDKRSYKAGAYDRLSPSNPINKGGMGAFEVNARYDHLDLNDKDIVGGTQKGAWLSVVWAPIDYVRLTANYGKLWINDAAIATADGDRNYSADTFGLRTQVDF
jgi:phosphate-selective porin OprO/OprP